MDCCATRLRCSVKKPELVNEKLLKRSGASGVIKKGQGVQIIYGPSVTVIKSNFEEYLKTAPDVEYTGEEEKEEVKLSQEETRTEEPRPQSAETAAGRELYSPFNGRAASITEAPDPAFSGKMMGDGFVVFPEDGQVLAPEDGQVVFVFPSKHAIGLKTADGIEYLLHIGVDTVKLDGKALKCL